MFYSANSLAMSDEEQPSPPPGTPLTLLPHPQFQCTIRGPGVNKHIPRDFCVVSLSRLLRPTQWCIIYKTRGMAYFGGPTSPASRPKVGLGLCGKQSPEITGVEGFQSDTVSSILISINLEFI